MFKLLGTRGSGKTYELLKEASRNKNAVVICSNPAAMKEKIRSYGLPEIECVSYGENVYNLIKKDVYIDEIDKCLNAIYPHIAGYTGSIE